MANFRPAVVFTYMHIYICTSIHIHLGTQHHITSCCKKRGVGPAEVSAQASAAAWASTTSPTAPSTEGPGVMGSMCLGPVKWRSLVLRLAQTRNPKRKPQTLHPTKGMLTLCRSNECRLADRLSLKTVFGGICCVSCPTQCQHVWSARTFLDALVRALLGALGYGCSSILRGWRGTPLSREWRTRADDLLEWRLDRFPAFAFPCG